MQRRSIAVLSAVFAAVLVSAAWRPAPERPSAPTDIVVVATTDVHGRLRGWDYYADTAETTRGLARAATIVDSVRAANPGRVILLDAGDLLQGNPLTFVAARIDSASPNPVIAAMNAMRYDAVAVGNHEFDYGLPALHRAMDQARFPFLAANAAARSGAARWQPYVIVERAGMKVGIVGATTPGAMVWDRQALAGRVEIGALVPAVRAAVRDARAAGADAVIVLAHDGLSGPSSYDTASTGVAAESQEARVARDVPGIDAIVFGHSHREVADTTINGVLLTQPLNWATSVSVAHLRFERRDDGWRPVSKQASLVRAAGHREAPAIVAAVGAGHARARQYAATVIGRTASEWRADSARVTDTPIMDFVAETMRSAAGTDLASVATFSVDAKIPAGPVTVAQLAQLYPYENTVVGLKISGAQLRAYLEHSARYYALAADGRLASDPAIAGYNHEIVTGADYTLDVTRPRGSRVTALAVKGRAVTPTDSFTIAMSNYRAGGGGGYAMLAGAPVVFDTQREIRQLLIDEVARRGTLRPEDYFVRNWRIVLTPAAPAPALATTIRIISTNDFHGAFEARPDGNFGMRGGAAQVATMIRRAEAECTGSCSWILLDGGDLFQGTPASNLAFGRPVVELYDALGYSAVALGNHEFDWGQDSLRARMRQAHFAILGANVKYTDGRDVEWIRDDTIVERGGVKIGIVGIATPLTPTTTLAAGVRGLRFDDPAPVVDAHARSLRARGAQLVVVVEHDGAFCARDTGCRGEIIDLAQKLTEPVDAIVSGHTHSLVNTVIKGIPIVQARSSGRAIGVVDLPLDRAARAGALHEVREVVTDSIPRDPQIAALVQAATAPVAAMVNQPIATVAETMTRQGPQHALGNLIVDAFRSGANADVGVINSGSVRADLRAGVATYGTLFEVQPFANRIVRVTVLGKDLRAYLEKVVGGPAIRAHVSNVVVRFDPSKPAGARVASVTVGGAALDDARTYTVAYTDFLATGGDGLGLATVALKQEALDLVDLDALITYAKARPGGVIRPDPAPRLIPLAP